MDTGARLALPLTAKSLRFSLALFPFLKEGDADRSAQAMECCEGKQDRLQVKHLVFISKHCIECLPPTHVLTAFF